MGFMQALKDDWKRLTTKEGWKKMHDDAKGIVEVEAVVESAPELEPVVQFESEITLEEELKNIRKEHMNFLWPLVVDKAIAQLAETDVRWNEHWISKLTSAADKAKKEKDFERMSACLDSIKKWETKLEVANQCLAEWDNLYAK